MKETPQYGSLEEWLLRTNTPRHILAEMAGISPQALSGFLRLNQRVSVMRAMRLSKITGIPVESLVEWDKFPKGVRDEHAA
jgi:transcriptional regulator with XRE-family HTH domain